MCTALPIEPEEPAGPSAQALWQAGPCGCSFGLPAAWPVLGRASPAMCHTRDSHRAGGEGWQVLERRELHGKVRTKITSVSGERVTRFKKKNKTLRFISLL